MCNLFSCIVTKDGKGLYVHNSDSHEDIISENQLCDNTADRNELEFARVEITPPSGDVFASVNKWKFKIDQSITPTWWNDGYKQFAYDALNAFLADALIDGKEIETFDSPNRVWIRNSKINVVGGSAKIGDVRGSAKIGYVRDNAKIGYVGGSANIGDVRGSANIGYVGGSANIGYVGGNAVINVFSKNATFTLNGFAIAIDRTGEIPVVIVAQASGIKVKSQTESESE